MTPRPVRQRGSRGDNAGDEGLVGLHMVVGGAAAIRAAATAGLLDRLAGGGGSAGQLAEGLGLDARVTRRLLDVLVALGLAAAEDSGVYRSTVEDRTLIDDHLRMWDFLPEVLRHSPAPYRVDRPDGAQHVYPGLVGRLGKMKAEAARLAAEHIAGPHLRVLDLGAGAAPWSLAVVAREPSCRVTALELPAVIPATRKAVEAAGRAGRFGYLAADLFQIELPEEAFDLAIVGNVCHLFGPNENRQLLLHLFQTLRPGGTVAIIDSLRDGAPRREQAIYALGLVLRAPEGDVYPLATYREWLLHAGFEAVEGVPLTERLSLTLITARRPTVEAGGDVHDGKRSIGEAELQTKPRSTRRGNRSGPRTDT